MDALGHHRAIQAAAKEVLDALGASIGPQDSERSIATRAHSLLADRGIAETWYYDCPALVLLGSRSRLSLSGRDYLPNDEPVGDINVVTVDLSPAQGSIWGDCARTFVIEDGKFTAMPQAPELQQGLQVESELHQAIRLFAKPETTFAELFAFGSVEIERHGYRNLDSRRNLGHSIASRREDRTYVAQDNVSRLDSVALFTFEPHIGRDDSRWGFKHEDIYYFDAQRGICAL